MHPPSWKHLFVHHSKLALKAWSPRPTWARKGSPAAFLSRRQTQGATLPPSILGPSLRWLTLSRLIFTLHFGEPVSWSRRPIGTHWRSFDSRELTWAAPIEPTDTLVPAQAPSQASIKAESHRGPLGPIHAFGDLLQYRNIPFPIGSNSPWSASKKKNHTSHKDAFKCSVDRLVSPVADVFFAVDATTPSSSISDTCQASKHVYTKIIEYGEA